MTLPAAMYRWVQTTVTSIITVSVALGLALNRRKNRESSPSEWPEDQIAPFVQVVAPMRNEEKNIASLLSTLLTQRYPAGRWGVTIVDDGSTDSTRSIALTLAASHPEISLVTAAPLPAGWTGKSHAMYQGFTTSPQNAEWLLFVDADTRHHPLMLASVIQAALALDADLLSLVIDVEMGSFWERVLVPQVGELYTLLVGTMDQVNKSGGKGGAAANGQFMLVRREIFRKYGELEQVRSDVAEDRALASAMKQGGSRIRLEFGRALVRARVYSSLGDMWNGYAKTLFWASGHDTVRTVGVVAALSLYALLPPAMLIKRLVSQPAARKNVLIHAAIELLPLFAVRVAVCRQMRIPLRYALTYPLGVTVGNAMLLYSMYRVLSGKGVRWKGRTYR